ncbi:hypothetical protein AA16663_0119 [Komagataeibacter rhaeticus DSM 16663]|nr:hypothetical protein AA16663_0119 [Komagataeibacter rhaeticus DSM 16663]
MLFRRCTYGARGLAETIDDPYRASNHPEPWEYMARFRMVLNNGAQPAGMNRKA